MDNNFGGLEKAFDVDEPKPKKTKSTTPKSQKTKKVSKK